MGYLILANSTDREAWLEARRHGVTATEIATLARGGAGAWSAIRAEKNGAQRTFTNAAMAYGHEREPVMAEFAQMAFDLKPFGYLVAHADYPQYLATPDALNETEIGEFKTTNRDWETWADVPQRYRDQILWQMFVTGARKARLIYEPHENYIPMYPFPKVLELDYDEDRVAELRQVADEFLNSDGDVDEFDPVAVELDALLTARVEAKSVADDAAAVVADLDEQIRALAASSGRTKFEGSVGNLTLSTDRVDRKFSSALLKTDDPTTYEKYMQDTPVKGAMRITVRTEQ